MERNISLQNGEQILAVFGDFDKNLKNCTKSESGEAVDGQAEENVVRWMKDGKFSNSGED